jgi:hypothetical protein
MRETLITTMSAKSRLYFVNGPIDAFFVGGASLLMIAALAIAQHRGYDLVAVPFAAPLAWLLNYPHFAATNHRLYSVRTNLTEYPLTAFAIPLAIAAATALALAQPSFAQGYVKLIVYWSPYHFAAQMVGIMLIYVRRAGIVVARWERPLLTGCFFACYLYATAQAEQTHRMIDYFGFYYPSLIWPPSMRVAAHVVLALSVVGFLAVVWRWSRQRRQLVPLIVLLPAATELGWYVFGARLVAFPSYQPLFHGLQYLFIAWMMQLKTRLDARALAPSPRFAIVESARWAAVTTAISLVLFWALPAAVGAATHHRVTGMLGIVFASIQLHHFFVDGVIWKLKSARVASPLMNTLADVAIAPEPPAERAAA